MLDLDRPYQKVFDLIESGSAKLLHKYFIPDLDGSEKTGLFFESGPAKTGHPLRW
jgi:hypothetical protein